MEAARSLAPQAEPDPTFDALIAEARRLRALVDGIDAHRDIAYVNAVTDLSRASAVRIERLVERVAAALACTDDQHAAIKRAPRETFDALTTPLDGDDGRGGLVLGNCCRCRSTLAWRG